MRASESDTWLAKMHSYMYTTVATYMYVCRYLFIVRPNEFYSTAQPLAVDYGTYNYAKE